MQSGEYITDRLLPEFVRAASKKQGIDFTSFSDDWILRLSKGDRVRFVVGNRFDCNQSAAACVAADKVAAYQILADSGVRSVPHVLARSVPRESIDSARLQQYFGGAAIVAKPLTGAGGHGVKLFDHIEDAITYIQASHETAWTFSQYQDIEVETRVVMLAGRPLLAYNKTNPPFRGKLAMFNLSLGASAQHLPLETLDAEMNGIASAAIQAMGLELAAVDIVTLRDGTRLVLEVNDSITMELFAKQEEVYRELAQTVYDAIVTRLFEDQ